MIDVKAAISLATDFLKSVYPINGTVRLEEVVFKEDPPAGWLITLSFLDFPSREYKRLDVDGDTGEVRSMVIRQLAH